MGFQKNQGSHVCVVDDDLGHRRSMVALLEAVALPCQAFESGRAFLDIATNGYCSCVVMDVRMPDMTGLQLLDHMRQANIYAPAIVMTGYGEVETVTRAFRNGAVDFFEKPVNGSLMIESIQRAIRLGRSQQAARDASCLVSDRLVLLSPREQEVLDLLIAGEANKQIAWKLGLSEKTIAAHRAHILRKMQAKSLPVLVRMIVEAKFFSQHSALCTAA